MALLSAILAPDTWRIGLKPRLNGRVFRVPKKGLLAKRTVTLKNLRGGPLNRLVWLI